MMKFNKTAMLFAISLSYLLVAGCGLRANEGEDLDVANATEIEVIKMKIRYIKDQYGNCFAILNNHTDGWRSTFTMASVNCNNLEN